MAEELAPILYPHFQRDLISELLKKPYLTKNDRKRIIDTINDLLHKLDAGDK